MSPQYFIGTSGWHYNHWRGNFYPGKMPSREWLSYYVQYFDTVEINASFYRLPLERTFTAWHETATSGFCFAVKASRFITHIKRLKDIQEPLTTFITRLRCLKGSLGPILFQLPPNMHRDDQRLESFLSLLKIIGKDLHPVFEFRHRSWMDDNVFELLRNYDAGFCIFDMPELTTPVVVTADFAYLRFHGYNKLYSSRYPDKELADWAQTIKSLPSKVKTVFVYFNNDESGFAVENARTLRRDLTGK